VSRATIGAWTEGEFRRVSIIHHAPRQRGLNASGDSLEVVLVQPADNPSVIMIRWPDAPTITTPAKLNETAATMMRILANAVTAYTQIKAAKHL
jgi:hypothetical protein